MAVWISVCYSMLQCVAVCCSVLQCVAMCCTSLQCVAVCCNVLQCVALCCITHNGKPLDHSPPLWLSVLQCVLCIVCCSVFHSVLRRTRKKSIWGAVLNIHACMRTCTPSSLFFVTVGRGSDYLEHNSRMLMEVSSPDYPLLINHDRRLLNKTPVFRLIYREGVSKLLVFLV